MLPSHCSARRLQELRQKELEKVGQEREELELKSSLSPHVTSSHLVAKTRLHPRFKFLLLHHIIGGILGCVLK
jgi:hypothetical protein